ncbi:RluA family pseudouridine synthase [Leptospira yasudae]|uniref:pseudouridine synthase n=1 Tax=Leptospira yasudae TaxID=2202201 RepID=UPI001C4E7FFF|nr:RluA family pseudouridine synthase [Leptospira yasudae]MBW0435498.1 RluA family pseudouridine synthase [Leptospira yasudae]
MIDNPDVSSSSERDSEILQIVISKEESGTRLDHFLSKKFTYHSRTAWQKEISEGRILVSRRNAKPGVLIREGDIVVYQPAEKEEPPVRTDYTILFEDDWIVAVNKPGDLPVHPAGVYRKGNLLTLLNESGRFGTLFTIHRLDRETSGAVLFAKNSGVASSISSLFSSGNIQKFYISKVYGDFPARKTAYGVLKPDSSSKIRKKRAFVERPWNRNVFSKKKNVVLENSSLEPNEEICLTYFQKIESDRSAHSSAVDKTKPPLPNDGSIKPTHSLVLCRPITGRMHQIRSTLYGLGFPLWGDKLYGKDEDAFLDFIDGKNPDLIARLGMERQALHAYAIRFVHPITKKKLKIVAPLPEDFS